MDIIALEREESELRQQLLELSLQKEQLLRDKKLQYFVPSPKQLQFIENADKRHRAIFAGNRFGKSTIGVVEDISWLLGERLFFPVGHPLRRKAIPKHGIKMLVIAEDWDKVHEIFTNDEGQDRLGKFFEFLPSHAIKSFTREQKGRINSITTRWKIDGVWRESLVVFDTVQSYKNNPKSFESSDWDVIHIDEPVMEELWRASARGLLDRGGHTWWLLTPLAFPWMYDHSTSLAATRPDLAWWCEASMDDNPLLDETAKAMYLETLPPEELEARKNGKPLAYGRRVYGHFDEKRHIYRGPLPPGWVDWRHPPANYHCGYALDPHPQTPDAVLFTAIAPDGTVWFYDEIFEKCMVGRLAELILEKKAKIRCSWELADPSAFIENKDDGTSWADTLHRHGLFVMRASKEKTYGIKETQQIWSPTSTRKVYVMPHMTRFIREIKSYFFDKENKPYDKDDHIMECLYRTVVHDKLQYRSPAPMSPGFEYAKDELSAVGNSLPPLTSISL